MRTLPLVVVLAACGESTGTVDAPTSAGTNTVTVVYSSRLDGEIEPCG